MRSGDQDSILFIRSAQRSDSGCYELTVHLEGSEAKANIDILVIGTWAEGKGSSLNRCHQPPTPELVGDEGRLGYHGKCQILGVETLQQTCSSSLTCIIWFCRETRAPKQHQATGCLGLQCCPRVDTTPGHRQHRAPGVHSTEGRQKDRGEADWGLMGVGKDIVQAQKVHPTKRLWMKDQANYC